MGYGMHILAHTHTPRNRVWLGKTEKCVIWFDPHSGNCSGSRKNGKGFDRPPQWKSAALNPTVENEQPL